MTVLSMLGLRTAAPFVVGDLSSPVGTRKAITIDTGDVGDDVKDGDWVTRFGWLMQWGEGCIRPAELESLRHEGDPLCDAVVRFFKLKTGQDALKALETYIATTPREEWDSDVAAFWESIACDPPGEVSALARPSRKYILDDSSTSAKGKEKAMEQDEAGEEERNEYTPDAAMRRLDRKPPPILSEGQAVFWRYSSGMLTTLLHFSLAGGFASARIMSVLHETGYLTSPSRDATYRRLMETTQALIDFLADMTPITGKGWKSAVRVRMLHSQVRIKILDGKSRLNTYSVEKDGIPINQEDLAATLGGFCMAPLWCQRRLGIHLSPQEELAFIAAWRHIGYYLGIKPDLLTRFYGTTNTTTATRSHRFFACVAFHLFRPELPKDPFATPTYTILHAVAHRPPQDKSTLYHCELSRFLLGEGLADQLAVPRGSLKDLFGVQQYAWTTWASTQFGRYYRKGWEMKRQALFRRIITLIVAWQLGERRSRFAIKDEKDYEKKISELKYDEAGEPAGLKMGIEVGKEVRRQARYLFIEMGVVIAGLGAACALALWQTAKMAARLT